MSVSAIKSIFEASKRRKVMPQPPPKKVNVEQPQVVIDEAKLKRAFNMVNNWQGSQKGLISFYNNLDEEEYQYVLSNRDELIFETKAVLWPDVFNPPLGANLKLKVRDISEEEYKRILIDNLKKREKLIDERIEKITIPSMPNNQLEHVSNNLKITLSTKEKQLEEVKKRIDTGKYVTPTKRTSVIENNPEVVSLRGNIQNIKNELEKIDERLKVLRDEWNRNETIKLRHKIEQELALCGV
jgi:hypothetical protein